MKIYLSIVLLIFFFGCNSYKKINREIIKVDNAWLDSIKRASDTSWSKNYRNREFVNADYYIDKKDSIVTQVMKDSQDNIRQILVSKYDLTRIFFAEYYTNGQMVAKLPLDSLGKYHGEAKYYYEDGIIRSKGNYKHGFYTGKWENYDSAGNHISTDNYNVDGQLVQ